MAVQRILKYPQQESLLRKKSSPITRFDKETRYLVRDLLDTVMAHPAVGLAAPQIGIYRQVIVVRFGQREDGDGELGDPVVIVNPEITNFGPPVRDYDGCLSIPGLYGFTYRPQSLEVRGLDKNGRHLQMALRGLDARAVHHETDHLRGILFLDKIQDHQNDLFVVVTDPSGETFLIPYSTLVAHVEERAESYRSPFIAGRRMLTRRPL